MDSLLKLQPPVVIDSADDKDTESLKCDISTFASRFVDAETEKFGADQHDCPLVLVPSPPATAVNRDLVTKSSRHDAGSRRMSRTINNVLTPSTISLPLVAASPAAEKVALVEESNNKGCLAYPGGAVLPALMKKHCDVERILYTLLPPKSSVCKKTGRITMRFVSLEPSLRTEVAELHERLLQQLHQRRARNSGVCPIRREIYTELFDELIRQVTLEEPARGILLLRVRDELYQTLAAHQSLIQRSMYFPSKLRTEAFEDFPTFKQRIKELEETRAELLARRKAAQVRVNEVLFAIEQEKIARAKVRHEEVGYYRRVNRQLAQRIKIETEYANARGANLCVSLLEQECSEVSPSPP